MSKNVIILSLGRVGQMVIMFATYRVLSTLFSAEEMSTYYFLLSIAGAFGLMYANPIGMYFNRIVHQSLREEKLHGAISSFIKLFSLGALAILPIIYFSESKLESITFTFIPIALILLFYILGTTLNGTFVSVLNLLGINNAFVVLAVMTSLAGLIFASSFVVFLKHEPLLWLLGQAIALVGVGLLALRVINKKYSHHKPEIPFKLNRPELLRFAAPIFITNIFVWIMAQSFRYFLKGNVDSTTLGEIGFGLGLASALAVAVEYLFQQLLFPGFYAALGDDKTNREASWNDLFNRSAPAFICLIFYMAFLSPHILNILADQKFKGAVVYFALGSIVELFRMLGNMVNMAYQSEMKTKNSIVSYAIGGTVTLLGILFISSHSEYLRYVPIVLIIGQILIFTSLTLNLRKMITIEVSYKRLGKYILQSLLFAGALLTYKYNNIFISILVCGLFGILLLFQFVHIQKERRV